MIVYLDSSVLARAYLPDEEGHESAAALLSDSNLVLITGTWTRVEVSGALVRAARASRCDAQAVLAVLDADLGIDGSITVVTAVQEQIEREALGLVRAHGLRAMDAWHLAVAKLTTPALIEPGEVVAFASRDDIQQEVAEALGFMPR